MFQFCLDFFGTFFPSIRNHRGKRNGETRLLMKHNIMAMNNIGD
jgi:hypothetical protein